MTLKSMLVCTPTKVRATRRDSLIAAGVMLGATLLFASIGVAARREGWAIAAEVFLNFGFLGALTLSMPFWLMKGQPWRAQVVVVSTTFALLVAIGYLAAVNS